MALSWTSKVTRTIASVLNPQRRHESGRPMALRMFEALEDRRMMSTTTDSPVLGTPIVLTAGERFIPALAPGDFASFELVGPGTATVTPVLSSESGPVIGYDVKIDKSNANSSFFVNDPAGIVALRDVEVSGSLQLLSAPNSDLVRLLSSSNGIGSIYLDDIRLDSTLSGEGLKAPQVILGKQVDTGATFFVADEVTGLDLQSQGTIRSMLVGQIDGMSAESPNVSIAAPAIIRIGVQRNLSGAQIMAEQIGYVSALGIIGHSYIQAEDAIFQVTAGAIHNSRITAGLEPQTNLDMPDSVNDFTNRDAYIGSVRVYGVNMPEIEGDTEGPTHVYSVIDSVIASWRINSVSFDDVQPVFADKYYGVAANTIGLISYVRPMLLTDDDGGSTPDDGTDGHSGHHTASISEITSIVPTTRVTYVNLVNPEDPRLATHIPGFAVELYNPDYIRPTYEQTPVIASSNGELDVTLVMSRQNVSINGGQYVFEADTYNGGLPGPTLRVKPGDILRVTITNNLDAPTNLHTHGLHVSPTGNSDNVFVSIPVGQSFEYVYQIPANHPEGLYWYHPHKHHLVNEQVLMGLSGLLIVERDGGGIPELQGLAQQYMSVRNVALDADSKINPNVAPNAQLTILNSQINPTISIRPNETQVWNVGNIDTEAWYDLALGNQPLRIVAIDGAPLNKVMTVDSFPLAPGQRVSFLVTGSATPGTFDFETLGFNQGFAQWPAKQLATVAVQGTPVSNKFVTPTTLNPYNNYYEDLRALPINQTVNLDFQVAFPPIGVVFPINGQLYDPNRIDVTAILNTVDEWVLTNSTTEWHPFHLHVNAFQVIEVNGVAVDTGGWQDVVGIPPMDAEGNKGTVKIRVKYEDFVGLTVFHCHILFHEDRGMMGNILITQPGYDGYEGSGGGHEHTVGAPLSQTASAVQELEEAKSIKLSQID